MTQNFQGTYRIGFKAILKCSNPTIKNHFTINWYLSKKSANTSEIKGNLTLLFPIDDSLNVSFFLNLFFIRRKIFDFFVLFWYLI